MAAVRLQLKAGYERQLMASPEMRKALGKAADHVAGEAKQAAPREPVLPKGRRKHYADMIDGVTGTDAQGPLGRVVALHFTSLWVEFGSVNNPPHAPLRRGLDASSGRAL